MDYTNFLEKPARRFPAYTAFSSSNGGISYATVLSHEPVQQPDTINSTARLLATSLQRHAAAVYIDIINRCKDNVNGLLHQLRQNESVIKYFPRKLKQRTGKQRTLFFIAMGAREYLRYWPVCVRPVTPARYYDATLQRSDAVRSFTLLNYFL